jgi:hypothetical protein
MARKAFDRKSATAAAQVSQSAQLCAWRRLYAEHQGHEAPSSVALAVWAYRYHRGESIEPTPADYERAGREHGGGA